MAQSFWHLLSSVYWSGMFFQEVHTWASVSPQAHSSQRAVCQMALNSPTHLLLSLSHANAIVDPPEYCWEVEGGAAGPAKLPSHSTCQHLPSEKAVTVCHPPRAVFSLSSPQCQPPFLTTLRVRFPTKSSLLLLSCPWHLLPRPKSLFMLTWHLHM